MPVTIKLSSDVFNTVKLRQSLSNFVGREAKDFKNLSKQRIIKSKPSGRLYRRKGGASFLRSHRASARGQRPAIDSGKLLNSIQDKRINEYRSEAFAGANYAGYVEGMDRPIMSEQDVREAQTKANIDGNLLAANFTN